MVSPPVKSVPSYSPVFTFGVEQSFCNSLLLCSGLRQSNVLAQPLTSPVAFPCYPKTARPKRLARLPSDRWSTSAGALMITVGTSAESVTNSITAPLTARAPAQRPRGVSRRADSRPGVAGNQRWSTTPADKRSPAATHDNRSTNGPSWDQVGINHRADLQNRQWDSPSPSQC